MCGIVGHLGPQNSVEKVLEGLKRLEYRGYDSAGVAFIDEHNDLKIYKKTGKLENLKAVLKDESLVARSCIGHTRWATHGTVNDNNSHPHDLGPVALVHNGIIENADEIRSNLKKAGYNFKSDTDTEVFTVLISDKLKQGQTFVESVSNSFKEIDGNSAFVILHSELDEILAIRRAAPLVCGLSTGAMEAYVSSDPYALVGMTDQLFFPEDEVLCSISPKHKDIIEFLELDGTLSKRYMQKAQDHGLEISDKGDFEHFMLKEIFEQPELIRSLTQYYFDGDGQELLDLVSKFKPDKIHITACGTAAYAGLVIRDFIEKENKIPCALELASEFRYRSPILGKNDLGLFVSQSGETADTLAATELFTKEKLKTLSIVNVDGSSLFRECDNNLLIRAGVEIGVASTKAFSLQALTGKIYSSALSGIFSNDKDKMGLVNKFSLLAERVDYLLSRFDEIKSIAEAIYNYKGFFFTGRGIYYPIALEGALKLKEIAYVHAEGYASGELKHGPIALIDEEMVNIAIVGPELYDKTVSNIQELKARKAIIVTIGPSGDKYVHLREISDYYIPMDFEGLDELAPLYVNIANQLLAYSMAKFKGTDIDRPRNLAKSVTVE